MMFYPNHMPMGFMGMHFFWWIFLFVAFFGFLIFLQQNPKFPRKEESSLEILRKRYARGEISTAEFEERKSHLLKDENFQQEAKT